jgi:hypothetical protein
MADMAIADADDIKVHHCIASLVSTLIGSPDIDACGGGSCRFKRDKGQ